MATKKKRPAPPPAKRPRAEPVVEDEDQEDQEELAIEEHDDTESDELELYQVVPEAPRIKALIYSEPGGGKTTLAATAQDHPDMGPVLFANIEGGLISVSHRRDLHAVDIRSTAALYALYRKLAAKEAPYDEIGTVVIDNITELQTLNLDEIVQGEVQSGKNSNRESVDDIWQEDYGTSTVQLSRIFRWFKGLDINLILTAHAKFVYPPSGNRRQGVQTDVEPLAVLPMLTQKLMKTVMGMVDFCWYLQYDPEGDQRLMLTRPDGIYQAKTRGPRFAKAIGAVVTNPDMPTLYNTLVRAQGKKSSREQ